VTEPRDGEVDGADDPRFRPSELAVELPGMSAHKFRVIRYCLFGYVLLTLLQILTKREDWPLSSFPMFSGVSEFGRPATRTLLVGVTEEGEIPLRPSSLSALMSAVRLQKIFQRLQKKSDEQQAEFMSRVAKAFGRQNKKASDLSALRFYVESWPVKPQLEGMDKPERWIEFAEYVPPRALVKRLKAEDTGETNPAPAVPLLEGDWLAELGAANCKLRCREVSDPLASGQHAVRLGTRGELSLTIPTGDYHLFVRMRTKAHPGDDQLALELDGRPVDARRSDLGNYKRRLPYNAWVWASSEPGWPALELPHRNRRKKFVLTLRATRSVVLIDQIWLAKARSELPIHNAPFETPETEEKP
jgi:hypothetical protein